MKLGEVIETYNSNDINMYAVLFTTAINHIL